MPSGTIDILKNKVLPVIVVILMFFIIQLLLAPFAPLLLKVFGKQIFETYPWLFLYFHHLIQMLAAILLMLLLGGGLRSYGFNLKSENLYVWPAVLVGVLFGIIMTVVDHGPTILSGNKITGYNLSSLNIFGWLSFEWNFAGISEEIAFRGLMQTYLMRKFTKHIRILKWDIHIAGIIIAIIFAVAHMSSFWSRPFIPALGQQIYAFILGLCYAYWFEKSKSLLPSIIGHNVGNGIEFTILFIMIYLGY